MNISQTQKKIYFSAYIGILLLYLKLFFIQPIFAFERVEVTFSLLLLLLIFVRVVFKLTILHVNVFGENKAARFFWLFVLVSTVSSFFLLPEIATGVVTANFQLFLIYLVFIDFKGVTINAHGVQKVIKALVYFAILNALLVVYTFIFGKIGLVGEVSEGGSITRAFGLMGDQVAWFLSFFGVHALYNGKKYHYVLFLVAILMGASLGALMVLTVATLIYFIREKGVKPSFYIKIGFSIVLFILVMLISPSFFDKVGIFQRINQGDFASTDSQTTGHRFNAITNAIDKISEKPLWGYQNYSLTMFNRYNNLLSETEKGNLTYLTTPNNQILAVMCDYGLIGFGFFVFFIFGLLKIIRVKSMNLPPNLYAFKQSAYLWLIVFLICNQSATWFLPGSFLWILICIIIGISYKINKLYGIK
jgi:hypothetical protein